MARLPSSGSLRGLVHLQKRPLEEDPYGGPDRIGDWTTQDTVACEFIPLKGGSETVIASRLLGIQPYIVRVRQSTSTRAVDETWRLVDARGPQPPDVQARTFAIKSITDPDQKRAWLEMLVKEGEPD